jgi:tetratricopeptide (TPR) repeat protein
MRLLLALMLVVAVPMPASVRADEGQDARAHYEKGTTLYDLGQYAEAAHEYELAFKLRPSAALLFNIGQAYRLAHEWTTAARTYRAYLRRAPDAANRTQVLDYITACERAAAGAPGPEPRAEKPAPAQPSAKTTQPSSTKTTPPSATKTTPPPAPKMTSATAMKTTPPSTNGPSAATAEPTPSTSEPATPSTAPGPTTTAAAPAPTTASPSLTATATAPAPTPLYKRWWLWTLVGVAVAGGAVAAGVTLGQPHDVTIPSGAHTVQFP